MFSIDIQGGIPIYEQLYKRIYELIATEVMIENEKLPPVREVAKELGVNPNTVQKTYQMLETSGLIYSIPAKGSYVSKRAQTLMVISEKAENAFALETSNALKRGVPKERLHEIVDITAKTEGKE